MPELRPLPAQLFQAATVLSCCFEPGKPEVFGLELPPALTKAVAKRQTEYLAGRWCVDRLYRQLLLNLPLPAYNEQGPPGWPQGWIGSISHSQNRAVAALAPRQAVQALGLDLEFCMDAKTAGRVRSSILRPEEACLLNQADSAMNPEQLLTLIFSFKESIYKAFNPLLGRFIGFDEVAVQRIDSHTLSFVPCGELSRDFPAGAPLQGVWLAQDRLVLTGYEWCL